MSHRQKKDRGSKGRRSTKPTRASSSRSKPAATAEPTTAEYLQERELEFDTLMKEMVLLSEAFYQGTEEYNESVQKNISALREAKESASNQFHAEIHKICIDSQSEDKANRKETAIRGNEQAMSAAAATEEGKKAIQKYVNEYMIGSHELRKTLKQLQAGYIRTLEYLIGRQKVIKEALDKKGVAPVPEEPEEARQRVEKLQTRSAHSILAEENI